MTSTTLNYNNNFKSAFFKTFKQRLVNMICLLVVSFLVPMAALIITFNENTSFGYGSNKCDVTFEGIVVSAVMACICGIFSLLSAPQLFKEIYKKQSCDAYFSMPIKREIYFSANFLYGIAVNTVAVIISTVIYLVFMPMMSTKNTVYTIDTPALIKSVIAMLLALLAMYSAFIMCAVVSGKKIHYLFLSVICMLCTSYTISGIVANLNSIWGLSVRAFLPMIIDPIQNASLSFGAEGANLAKQCIVSIIEIIGMYFAGLIIFKRRKAEIAEVTVTGKVIPFLLLALMCCSVYMRYSTLGIAVVSIIVGIVAVVLITMAFSGIFFRKVFTKETAITAGAVCLACTVFICVVYFPSHSRYVTKIPDVSEIESVELSSPYEDEIFISSFMNLFSSTLDLDADYGDKIVIKEEKSIADAVALHERLVDEKVIEMSKKNVTTASSLLQYIFSYDSFSYTETYGIKLTYTLKSGKTITRSYSAASKLLTNEYANLMKNEDVLVQTEPFDIKNEDFLFAKVDATTGDTYLDYDYDDNDYYKYYDQLSKIEDFEEFTGIYMSEVINMTTPRFLNTIGSLSSDYYDTSSAGFNCKASLTIYKLSPDAPQEIKDKVKSMSPAAIEKARDSWFYTESTSPMAYVDTTIVEVFEGQDKSLEYLAKHGVKFPEN